MTRGILTSQTAKLDRAAAALTTLRSSMEGQDILVDQVNVRVGVAAGQSRQVIFEYDESEQQYAWRSGSDV